MQLLAPTAQMRLSTVFYYLPDVLVSSRHEPDCAHIAPESPTTRASLAPGPAPQ